MTVVAPVGEIDIATIQPVREALEATAGPLRLDLSAVTFLDTTGLRLVVEQERVCRAAHRPFSIVAGPADVQRIFDIAGLRDRLPFTSPDGTPAGGTPPAA